MVSKQDVFARLVDDVVTFLNLSGDVVDAQRTLNPITIPGIKYFDGADIWSEETVDMLYEAVPEKDFLPTNVSPRLLGRSVDVSIVRDSIYPGAIQVSRARQVSPKDVRGKVYRFFPVMVAFNTGFLDLRTGRLETQVNIYGWASGKWVWVPPHERVRMTGSGTKYRSCTQGVCSSQPRHDAIALHVAVGWQFTRDAFWRVYLAPEDGIGVTFSTDGEGAKEVFRLRDIPPGRKRRAAILHWVREHYRRNRTSASENEVLVREHFRGETEFSWNGLRCVITPPKTTLERVLTQYKEWTPKLKGVVERVVSVPNNE